MPKSVASARQHLRPEAPAAEINSLIAEIEAIRGLHRVEAHVRYGTEQTYLYFRGTERAVRVAQSTIAFSGLQSPELYDHDHDACIASARAMGVPAAWAHRPETYLSM